MLPTHLLWVGQHSKLCLFATHAENASEIKQTFSLKKKTYIKTFGAKPNGTGLWDNQWQIIICC